VEASSSIAIPLSKGLYFIFNPNIFQKSASPYLVELSKSAKKGSNLTVW
jgi:hypothetical protein